LFYTFPLGISAMPQNHTQAPQLHAPTIYVICSFLIRICKLFVSGWFLFKKLLLLHCTFLSILFYHWKNMMIPFIDNQYYLNYISGSNIVCKHWFFKVPIDVYIVIPVLQYNCFFTNKYAQVAHTILLFLHIIWMFVFKQSSTTQINQGIIKEMVWSIFSCLYFQKYSIDYYFIISFH